MARPARDRDAITPSQRNEPPTEKERPMASVPPEEPSDRGAVWWWWIPLLTLGGAMVVLWGAEVVQFLNRLVR